MQKKINDGGPAFPAEYQNKIDRGMTLRDWLAGQVVSQLNVHAANWREWVPQKAYEIADALLEQREKDLLAEERHAASKKRG